MVLLGGWHLFHVNSCDALAGWRRATRRLVLGWALILVVLNWRLGGWLAAYRGVNLAEIHGLLPVWVMPVATVTLVVWIGALMAWTRPGSRATLAGR
jgi:hypothetical protein